MPRSRKRIDSPLLRVALALASVFALMTACQAVGSIAQGVQSFLAQSQVIGTTFRPSQYFCGNQVKPGGPIAGRCAGRATDGPNGVAATERTEIRGWMAVQPGPNDCDPAEVCFTIQLDYGWQQYTDSTVVNALNTPEKIVQALTPHDVMQFAPGDLSGGGLGPLLDSSGFHAWGGSTSASIHAEADGFRLRAIPGFPAGANSAALAAAPPTDWTVTRDSGASLWPFDPMSPPTLTAVRGGLPALGDYVHVVGTLWEDDYHSASPHTGEIGKSAQQASQARDAKNCWHEGSLNQGSTGRGWREIHPVDVFQRINEEKPGLKRDVLDIVAACGNGELIHDIHVALPRAGESVHFTEIPNSTFTVRPADVVIDSISTLADGIRVHLKLSRGGLFAGNPKFFGGYHVWIGP